MQGVSRSQPRTVVSSRMPGAAVNAIVYCVASPSARKSDVSEMYTSGSGPLGSAHSWRRVVPSLDSPEQASHNG